LPKLKVSPLAHLLDMVILITGLSWPTIIALTTLNPFTTTAVFITKDQDTTLPEAIAGRTITEHITGHFMATAVGNR
jgi:hypothetical protein